MKSKAGVIFILVTAIGLGAAYFLWTNQVQTNQNGVPTTTVEPTPTIVILSPMITETPPTTQSAEIILTAPQLGDTISSPLIITGQAPGTWFFEAVFPVTLTDEVGEIIAKGVASADGEWMTTELVPFTAELTFDTALVASKANGFLILQKDNPSGLPENDASYEVAVTF